MYDAMKTFIDHNGIHAVIDDKEVGLLKDSLDQKTLNNYNQEKENEMEPPIDGALNSCVNTSPVKTPVIPTRKNTNRRVSMPDLFDASAANSES